MTALLEAQDLEKSYGPVRALAGVSLAVAAGEVVALIGPNGAGKSTCFALLGGQLRPDRGSVRLRGTPIAGRSPHTLARLGIARTFQVAATFASLTVRENVQLGLAARAALPPWGRLRGDARPLLDRVGLAARADEPAAALAYGDVKRLELAIALAAAPVLLLMDEPTAGMGAAERAALMALVAGLARRDRLGILFTEHDMDVVFRHADRVLVLAEGRLLAAGTPAEIRADPAVRAAYLG